jgi:hypothetical protein
VWRERSWNKAKQQSQSAGHCLSSVHNYYLSWKYLTVAASAVRSWWLTACALWHGQNLPLVSWYSHTLVCEYLANIKGNKHVDFTDRGKANLVNTFILNSRHISFSLLPPTSQFPHFVWGKDLEPIQYTCSGADTVGGSFAFIIVHALWHSDLLCLLNVSYECSGSHKLIKDFRLMRMSLLWFLLMGL